MNNFSQQILHLELQSKISVHFYQHMIWFIPLTIPQIGMFQRFLICSSSPFASVVIFLDRECGWRTNELAPACLDPCAVCLERKCMVAVEGTFLLNGQSNICYLSSINAGSMVYN